ncbi:MAG: large-conductance mechanosensitive channel protein MscL [candidate division Zixibacteria bacterium]|nr:large-conductance mechanosensitive channel protein MscL [candidate division Zixibacteria bacterium]
MIKEFKDFVMRGNVLDMAVGIIIGAAFGTIVTSLVSDVIMPPIGLALGNVDFSNLFLVIKPGLTPPPYTTPSDATAAGAVTINYGMFITRVISFLIVAFSVFMLVRAANRMIKKEVPTPVGASVVKECTYCLMTIPIKAAKCGHCASDLRASYTN